MIHPFRHFYTITKHRHRVIVHCFRAGIGFQGLFHDLSKYTLLKKGTARQDWSMHVEFLNDQMAFRVILRVSGTPELTQAVKIKNSETKRSAFIALGGA
jgi:hypothetical protein